MVGYGGLSTKASTLQKVNIKFIHIVRRHCIRKMLTKAALLIFLARIRAHRGLFECESPEHFRWETEVIGVAYFCREIGMPCLNSQIRISPEWDVYIVASGICRFYDLYM